jgi:kynurenine formamidase
LDLGDVLSVITRERLQTEEIPSDRHVLIKTRNSTLLRKPDFHHDYVYLDPPAVEYLLRRNPRSIGFDYYSLDPSSSETFPAHRLCAEAGLPVFVCLDLTRVEAGPWWFCGLPPAIPDVEGAPVRAIVWRDT